jgi:hypothetical protein
MNETPSQKQTSIKSLLYWRKSKLNGAKCVPAILSLDADGNFSLKDRDGSVVYSVPVKEADVAFTGWGTMVINAPNAKYDIVGSGAGISPSPTQEQLEEVRAAQGDNQTTNNVATKLGAAGVAVGTGAPEASAVGSVAMGMAFQEGVNSIGDWQKALIAAGAKVKQSKMRNFIYYVVAIIVILIVGLIIAISHKQ